ncbi:hypothetical protein DFH06DRAFT_1445492 [Mycena polygramma]|nr:hypothetical protein DFH06DRAFT_1445492 [Mycena polygramma]
MLASPYAAQAMRQTWEFNPDRNALWCMEHAPDRLMVVQDIDSRRDGGRFLVVQWARRACFFWYLDFGFRCLSEIPMLRLVVVRTPANWNETNSGVEFDCGHALWSMGHAPDRQIGTNDSRRDGVRFPAVRWGHKLPDFWCGSRSSKLHSKREQARLGFSYVERTVVYGTRAGSLGWWFKISAQGEPEFDSPRCTNDWGKVSFWLNFAASSTILLHFSHAWPDEFLQERTVVYGIRAGSLWVVPKLVQGETGFDSPQGDGICV